MAGDYLILGVNGQDGILLSKLLISEGKTVIGVGSQPIRSSFVPDHVEYFSMDIRDTKSLFQLIRNSGSKRIFNLAGFSSVSASFLDPGTTDEVNFKAVSRLLETLYSHSDNLDIRFFQSSSSEMFGPARENAHTEKSQFNPLSPYAVSKTLAHECCQEFRQLGFFVSCGILFNHESIYRPSNYISRKITQGVAKLKLGLLDFLEVGDLEIIRDWGSARDYVHAMKSIIDHTEPNDYVVATGKEHTIRELIGEALHAAGLDSNDFRRIRSVKEFRRTNELKRTVGNPEFIRKELGWQAKTSIEDLIQEMFEFDYSSLLSSINSQPTDYPAPRGE